MTTANNRSAIDRPDVGLILASEWTVGTAARQQAVVEANAATWRHIDWPDGLLRHDCLVGVDGNTVMHYHQWTGEQAYQDFTRTGRTKRMRTLDDKVPDIERHGLTRYELYRSHRSGDQERRPGCVVVVGIGADSADRAEHWVDTVIAALDTDVGSRPSLISAHFHVSADGSRILNYAEWTDVQEHVNAVDNADASVGHGAAWDAVRTMPGIVQLGFKRFRPAQRLVRACDPRVAS